MSMHIASLVKIPCYVLKLSSGNENMGMSWADNYVKIWRNLPISNPKPDLLNVNAYTHVASLVKIPCYLLKLSSGNENMGGSRADNSVKIWQNLPISNSISDLLNVNAYSKLSPENEKQTDGRLMDGPTHGRPMWNHYCVAGYKNVKR